MKISAVVLIVAVLVAGVTAAPCNTTALTQILTSENMSTCQTESGYNFTSMTMPSDAQVSAVCTSSACMDSLDSVKQVAPDECTIGPIRLYANVINPLSQRCGSTTGTGSVDAPGSGSGPLVGDVGNGSLAGNACPPANASMSGSLMDSPVTNTPQPSTRPSYPSPTPTPATRTGGADAPTLSMCAAIAVLAAAVAIIS